MADDIIKVVFDLSMQTSNQDQLNKARAEIQAVADAQAKQREAESRFTAAQTAELKARQQAYAKLNDEEKKAYDAQIKTTEAIKGKTSAQKSYAAESEKILKAELGQLGKLKELLAQLKKERLTSNDTKDIAQYSTQIRQVAAEIKALEKSGSGETGFAQRLRDSIEKLKADRELVPVGPNAEKQVMSYTAAIGRIYTMYLMRQI
jgi:multidrug efflux pump subunit AcrA (membrane-fusion protein)